MTLFNCVIDFSRKTIPSMTDFNVVLIDDYTTNLTTAILTPSSLVLNVTHPATIPLMGTFNFLIFDHAKTMRFIYKKSYFNFLPCRPGNGDGTFIGSSVICLFKK